MATLPGRDERTIVIGATGSGKTRFATWLLSTRDWFSRPWFILDFKGERLFDYIGVTELAITAPLPTEAGLYRIRILPGQDELVSAFFMKCYSQENVGIFTDELYMLPYQDKWVRTCLTQGRSKNIEMISCTQRPVRADVFFFSEASYFAVFNLNVAADKKRVSEYMDGLKLERLPKYHCLWYDVADNEATIFEPVPSDEEIIEDFLPDEIDLEENMEDDLTGQEEMGGAPAIPDAVKTGITFI